MKKVLLAAFLVVFSATFARAENEATLKKIEDYLNGIKTMEADFIQSASNGSLAEGKLYIQKPNKINMQYNQDSNIQIIGDGKFVIYNDKDLDQVTHINYKDIPATLILGNDIKIDGKNIKATGFYEDEGITAVTFRYAESENVGPITLVFNNSPFELKQWKIVDPQNIEITLSLYNTKRDHKLSSDLFKFKNNSLNPLND